VEQQNLLIIGRREFVDFPELSLTGIEAKIDTGAFTSSIHCDYIKAEDGKVHCVFLDKDHPQFTGETHVFEIFKRVKVRSSNGQEEDRFMIETNIRIFNRSYPILLTLTDRSNMNYPILLGRRFLSSKFIVDVTLKHQILK
jgi:hypothetical protein